MRFVSGVIEGGYLLVFLNKSFIKELVFFELGLWEVGRGERRRVFFLCMSLWFSLNIEYRNVKLFENKLLVCVERMIGNGVVRRGCEEFSC